jgi:hypothetical protein
VLPAWATVLIALGGSAIGATAGIVAAYFTLRGSTLTIGHHEREARLTRMVDVARDFSALCADLFFHLNLVFQPEEPREVDEELRAKLGAWPPRLWETAVMIGLFFGPDSAAGRGADLATADLSTALFLASGLGQQGADGDVPRRRAGKKSLNSAAQAHETFLRAAYDDIQATQG